MYNGQRSTCTLPYLYHMYIAYLLNIRGIIKYIPYSIINTVINYNKIGKKGLCRVEYTLELNTIQKRICIYA